MRGRRGAPCPAVGLGAAGAHGHGVSMEQNLSHRWEVGLRLEQPFCRGLWGQRMGRGLSPQGEGLWTPLAAAWPPLQIINSSAAPTNPLSLSFSPSICFLPTSIHPSVHPSVPPAAPLPCCPLLPPPAWPTPGRGVPGGWWARSSKPPPCGSLLLKCTKCGVVSSAAMTSATASSAMLVPATRPLRPHPEHSLYRGGRRGGRYLGWVLGTPVGSGMGCETRLCARGGPGRGVACPLQPSPPHGMASAITSSPGSGHGGSSPPAWSVGTGGGQHGSPFLALRPRVLVGPPST